MIRFDQLLSTAPAVARPIRDRLVATGLGILGTVRASGAPRVSPIEVAVIDDRLWLGMMPGSRKLLDVRRDRRVALLTPVADKDDHGGEGKLFGELRELDDPAESEALLRRVAAAGGMDPEQLTGSPMFELLVDGAAWQHVDGDSFVTWSWREDEPVRHRRRVGAIDLPREVPVA